MESRYRPGMRRPAPRPMCRLGRSRTWADRLLGFLVVPGQDFQAVQDLECKDSRAAPDPDSLVGQGPDLLAAKDLDSRVAQCMGFLEAQDRDSQVVRGLGFLEVRCKCREELALKCRECKPGQQLQFQGWPELRKQV